MSWLRTVLVLSVLALVALAAPPRSLTAAPDEPAPQAAVVRYHTGLIENDPAAVRAALGKEFLMFNGNFSGEPTAWQAHLYLTGERLERWPALFLKEAGPYENRFEFIHTHVHGDAAVVVTRETGKNRFRSWQGETVTWLLGRSDGEWKIVGFFIRDIRNPE